MTVHLGSLITVILKYLQHYHYIIAWENMPDKFYTSQDKWLTFQIYLENPPNQSIPMGLPVYTTI